MYSNKVKQETKIGLIWGEFLVNFFLVLNKAHLVIWGMFPGASTMPLTL